MNIGMTHHSYYIETRNLIIGTLIRILPNQEKSKVMQLKHITLQTNIMLEFNSFSPFSQQLTTNFYKNSQELMYALMLV